jgi:hypothetical protein
VVCGIGMAAVAGWLLAGGSLPSTEALFGQHEPAAVDRAAGDAPFHLESTPSGAAVRIDGANRGKTPLDTWLSPGQHALSLHHPDTLDDDQALPAAEAEAHVKVALWRQRPEVVQVRPVYPGASLVDARFLDGGQVALLIGLSQRAGAPGAGRELWRLDPTTGAAGRRGEAQPFALLLTVDTRTYSMAVAMTLDGLAVLRIIRTEQPSTLGLHQIGRFNPQGSGELANRRGTWLQATFDLQDGLTTDTG